MPVRARETTTAAWPAPPAVTAPRAPEVFATAGVPDTRRVELWESHNAAALIGLDVRAARPLEATEVNVRLPQARLARVSGSAHAVERTAAVIDRCPADSVAAYLALRGDARFAGQGGRYALRPGDVLVCETDQPFTREFPRGLAELVVTIPRSALAARAGVTRLRAPVVVSFGGTAAGAAGVGGAGDPRQYARALARIAGRATRTAGPLTPDERTVLDLVAALAGGRGAARGAAHRAAAFCYIEEHLADPGLGAAEIAAAVGLSERQLSRVFAADGISVPRHILSRRLELAYAALAGSPAERAPAPRHTVGENRAGENTGRTPPARDRTDEHRTDEHRTGESAATESVASVAARCGFTSSAYFSHAFRARFGLRAGEVRRGGALPRAGSGAAPLEGW